MFWNRNKKENQISFEAKNSNESLDSLNKDTELVLDKNIVPEPTLELEEEITISLPSDIERKRVPNFYFEIKTEIMSFESDAIISE
jgi:hypothetical protein